MFCNDIDICIPKNECIINLKDYSHRRNRNTTKINAWLGVLHTDSEAEFDSLQSKGVY